MAKPVKKVKFQLTNGKKPVSWTLPVKGMMLPKKGAIGKVLKKVHYIKGAESIFVEDYEGDEKPSRITFEDGTLSVNPLEKNLIALLINHKWYGTLFEKVDYEEKAKSELEGYEMVELALEKVNIVDADELKAHSLIIIGPSMFDKSEDVIRAAMKRKAFKEAEFVLEEMNSPYYNTQYISALSILKGALVVNATKTQVLWANNKKPLVNVAVGQDPIKVLAEFLAGDNERAVITLQELGKKLKRSYVKKLNPDAEEEIQKALEAKESFEEEEEEDFIKNDLELARKEYSITFDKNVPPNKKNDLEWLRTKVLEAKESFEEEQE